MILATKTTLLAPLALLLAPAAQDLPDLTPMRLPWIEDAAKDEPTEPRAVVEIHSDGSVRVHGGDPIEADDDELWSKVESGLKKASEDWKEKQILDAPPMKVREGRVLFRCDATAPMSAVQRVMQISAGLDPAIPGFDFACREFREAEAALDRGDSIPGPTDELARCVAYDLPVQPGPFDWKETEKPYDVHLDEVTPGTRIAHSDRSAWEPGRGRAFFYSSDRKIAYRIGPKRIDDFEKAVEMLERIAKGAGAGGDEAPLHVVLRTAPGIRYGEVLVLMHELQSAGDRFDVRVEVASD